MGFNCAIAEKLESKEPAPISPDAPAEAAPPDAPAEGVEELLQPPATIAIAATATNAPRNLTSSSLLGFDDARRMA
jgi:hypothetical protein